MFQRTPEQDGAPADTRGQTTIDYGVGVSLFLLTVIFIFTFVPSLFQPFTSDQSQIITADRTADMLAEDLLLSDDADAERYIVDQRCAVRLVQQLNGDTSTHMPHDCRFDPSVTSPQKLFGLKAHQHVNITIEPANGSQSGIVSFDPDGQGGQDATRMAVGQSPPAQGTVVAAQRSIYVQRANGSADEYRLFVRVW